jgi:hypothetical protein
MTFTHHDVLRAIQAWQLESVVTCREIKGKTELTYNGETAMYPHWLAVRKANQIGASYQSEAL